MELRREYRDMQDDWYYVSLSTANVCFVNRGYNNVHRVPGVGSLTSTVSDGNEWMVSQICETRNASLSAESLTSKTVSTNCVATRTPTHIIREVQNPSGKAQDTPIMVYGTKIWDTSCLMYVLGHLGFCQKIQNNA